jgi:predicted MPP superfamily phosphohydrolase
MTSMRVQREAIARVNATKPHLIALTGDFVAHGLGYLDALGELLDELDARAFAVLGNHDHWSGPDEVRQRLLDSGVEVLDNAWTTIDVDGTPLQIVGVDDAYTGNADVERATRGLNRDAPTLALSHIPEVADELWARGAELVLSGHTHGGQIAVGDPHGLSVAAMAGHRYVHGLYGDRRGDGAVYVSAGIGAAVFPLRFGARSRSEVAVFDLGAELGAIEEDHSEQPALRGRLPSEAVVEKRRAEAKVKASRNRRTASKR